MATKRKTVSVKMTENSLKNRLETEKKKAAARKAKKDKIAKKKKMVEEIKKVMKA